MKPERNRPRQNGKPAEPDRFVAGFYDMIKSQGYIRGTVGLYHRSAKSLCKEMIAKHLKLADLNDNAAGRIITKISSAASAADQKHCRYRLERFRDYLIKYAGAPARAAPKIDISSRACLKREYETYLKDQRGLADSTIYDCLRYYDRFLTFKFGDGLSDLDTIKPDNVTGNAIMQCCC